MGALIGRCVLKGKPKSSYDIGGVAGQIVLMTPKEVRRGFIQRTREARERSGLTQEEISGKLGIKQDTYKNYETIRPLPHAYVPEFCSLCEIDPKDLYPAIKRPQRSTAA